MRSRADVDEVVQETCLRVLEACRERRINGPTRNYAFGVLRYVSLELLRKGARDVSLTDEDGGGDSESGGTASPADAAAAGPPLGPTLSLVPPGSPAHDDDDEGALEALMECLGELPQTLRAFILRCSSEHGAGVVISKENGESPNAVNLRAYKIRATLRKCIESKVGPGKGMTR